MVTASATLRQVSLLRRKYILYCGPLAAAAAAAAAVSVTQCVYTHAQLGTAVSLRATLLSRDISSETIIMYATDSILKIKVLLTQKYGLYTYGPNTRRRTLKIYCNDLTELLHLKLVGP